MTSAADTSRSGVEIEVLKMGILGIGVSGARIARAMAAMPEIELVAGAARRPELHVDFAERYGAKTYGSAEEICRDPEVQALWISTPNQFHAEHMLLAASHGKHIIIEAPVHVLNIPKKEAIERAEKIMDRVGVGEKKDVYPAFLSGGQQQRVAIARALAIDPEVMLFDEPTSALDPELVGEVLKVIRSLADEGRTMIMVTHEMGFARDVSSHVIYLHQGLVEEEGPPKKLFYQPDSERCKAFVSSIT